MDTHNNTLWLKFSGDELDIRSVPIYELGDVLIAVQRIIHKSYLANVDRQRNYAHLTQDERRRLSLQIQDRRKSSDLYGLVPFLTDGAIQGYVFDLIKTGLGALAKYALKQAFSEPGPKEGSRTVTQEIRDVRGSMLTGAIYAETVQITNHINNIGGVEKIDFIVGDPHSAPVASFDPDVQAYVRKLATSRYFGERTEIEGYLTKIHANRRTVEIKAGPKRYIEVHVSDDDFATIRYRTCLLYTSPSPRDS